MHNPNLKPGMLNTRQLSVSKISKEEDDSEVAAPSIRIDQSEKQQEKQTEQVANRSAVLMNKVHPLRAPQGIGRADDQSQVAEEAFSGDERKSEQGSSEGSNQYHQDGGAKKQEDMDQKQTETRPQLFEGQQVIQNSNWFSRVFFYWLGPLMRFTQQHDELTVQNYGIIGDQEKAVKQIERLREQWKARTAGSCQKNALILSIFSCYRWELAQVITCSFFSILMKLVQPFFLFMMIQYVKDGKNQLEEYGIHFYDFEDSASWIQGLTQSRQYGLTLGFCMLSAQFFQFVIDNNVFYLAELLAAKSSNGLIGLIYEKQTKIYSSNKEGFTSGHIINFIQVDAYKLHIFLQQLSIVSMMPLLIVAALSILYHLLGFTFISGIVVFAISFYANAKIAHLMGSYQDPYMEKQDKRVGLTTEALNNIKMLKLYGWINTIKDQIKQRRAEEFVFYKKIIYLRMLLVTTLYFFPTSLQAVCYSFFIGFGNKLSLNTGYVVLSVFNLIADPIRELPAFVGFSIEFYISMHRVQKFLLMPELNETVVSSSSPEASSATSQISVKISPNSCFFWALKGKKEDEEGARERESEQGNESGLVDESRNGLNGVDVEVKGMRFRDIVCLKNIELEVRKGQFVCVIGDVAAGKSSLLSAILGELHFLDQKFVEENGQRELLDENFVKQIEAAAQKNHTIPPVQINQSISYVQQTPWIQNKTIKENILFGLEYDSETYNRTIELCELTRDLEILPAGDGTEIGEQGINLSGGQKARVALARAVYADRDLILMDDPISALDANVKKSIFNNVMLNHLKNKTRILVTHAVDFLEFVDTVVVIKNGEIVLKGAFKDIKDDDYLQQLIRIHKTNQNNQSEIQKKEAEQKDGEQLDNLYEKSPLPKSEATPTVSPEKNLDDNHHSLENPDAISLDGEEKSKESKQKDPSKGLDDDSTSKSSGSDQSSSKVDKKYSGKIMTDEQDEKISVTFRSYYDYYKNYYGGMKFLSLSLLTMSLFLVSKMSADYLIGHWALQKDQKSNFSFYCGLSFAFAGAQGLFIFCRAACMQLFGMKATRKLHEHMIERVLKAPINLYFDTTPIGRILNKFTKDLSEIESIFSFLIGTAFGMLFLLIYSIVVGIIVLPYLALMLPVILYISYLLLIQSKNGIKESVRLVSTTSSPLLSHLGETISGSPTIRAFGSCDKFIERNIEYLDQNILANQFQAAVSAWFIIRVDIFSILIMMVLTVVVVMGRKEDGSNAIILSMLMTQTLTIQDTLTVLLQVWLGIETLMVNVVRCMRLCEVKQECQIITSNNGQIDQVKPVEQHKESYPLKGRSNWPESGRLEFKNVHLKYRPDTEIVLKNLSFRVNPGEKIGIVGRTGAGKSTICLGISRIVELLSGQIFIDGIDISQIKLDDLRQRITVIPQDPTMFSGSLRFNLDPEEKCSDETILDLLHKANLQSMLEKDPKGLLQEITENGQNLSSGQRQLICICRAILRKSNLVVLDEATANIDVITEQQIQKLINTQFSNATMLVVAHRINTIIQSDRVLVLSFGQIQEYDTPAALMADSESEFSKLIKDLKKQQKEKECKSVKSTFDVVEASDRVL